MSDAPRIRQLDVRDDHVLELLTAITEIIRQRINVGIPVGLPAQEMHSVLMMMAKS
jgi:hypothetical protein